MQIKYVLMAVGVLFVLWVGGGVLFLFLGGGNDFFSNLICTFKADYASALKGLIF